MIAIQTEYDNVKLQFFDKTSKTVCEWAAKDDVSYYTRSPIDEQRLLLSVALDPIFQPLAFKQNNIESEYSRAER